MFLLMQTLCLKNMPNNKKIAVVLLNLGAPKTHKDIKPFLGNFFSDKAIIPLPFFLRRPLAWFIASKRSNNEAKEAYGHLGGGSPLLENTNKQAAELQSALGDNYKVFTCMRYWHPMSDEVARNVKSWGADSVVLLPMYPQFSLATTQSSFDDWDKKCPDIPNLKVHDYFDNEGFINAGADRVQNAIADARASGYENYRVLFCAHGLPQRDIDKNPTYQIQCEKTASLIASKLQLDDWQICYQSRVGPLKWIEPSIGDSLKQAAEDGVAVVIFPHSFTQEHVETLVELDIEYKEFAEQVGIEGYFRAQTVGKNVAFIDALKCIVHKKTRALS